MISDIWQIVGLVLVASSFYWVGRVRPLRTARMWAFLTLRGDYGPRRLRTQALALLLLIDVVVRARRHERDLVRAGVRRAASDG